MTTLPTNQTELTQEAESFREYLVYEFESVVTKKINSIASYLKNNNIESVVLGVSGGIDSAVVLALLCKVREIYPTLKIHALNIHFSLYNDVFDKKYVDDLQDAFGRFMTFMFSDATKSLKCIFKDLDIPSNSKHLMAQSSYALRYQMFFTYAQDIGAVTVGTTNLDEFKYAGWFGKNSDMVVDLQVITDWHKCQVVEAAKMLGVPQSIIDRAPVGDLLDMSTDEANFGCTYDELAWFQEIIVPNKLEEANVFLIEKFDKLRGLHKKNLHKYQGQTFNPIFL